MGGKEQVSVAVRHRIEDLGKAPGTRLHLGGLNSVSRRLALTMKHERAIKKAGYVTLAALLALVAFSYWVSHRIECGETPAFLSEGLRKVLSCGNIRSGGHMFHLYRLRLDLEKTRVNPRFCGKVLSF
jgi:hypothetical protein